jgi:hypothetical protein
MRKAEPSEQRGLHLSWRGALLGAAVAFVLLAVLSFLLSPFGVGGDLSATVALDLLALAGGGYVAGRVAARQGAVNGSLVAIPFIFFGASLKHLAEAELVRRAGPFSLGSMNMGGLMLDDLFQLGAAALGGWLGARPGRTRRARRARGDSR